VTAFLSSGPKAAGFAALIRILVEGLGPMQPQWSQVLWLLAVVTMTLGNVVAIQQDNIKRMLAYSSIAHAGYILAALVVGGPEGLGAVVFYALAYTFMNTGAFGVLILASDERKERVVFEDFRGFGFVSPAVGAAMFVFMLSLAGIPLTAGFAGKFQIFKSAVDGGFIWLAVIGVLNSVVSVYYYLRMVVVMYMQPATAESLHERPPKDFPGMVEVARQICTALDHAHQHGIIHRDLKPENVLVDAETRPHITDFGLARIVGKGETASSTKSNEVVGTPPYVSPEQAIKPKSVDHRTDIYAMGVMLYEALSGLVPFRGKSGFAMLMSIVHDPVTPPRQTPRGKGNPEVDAEIERVCLKAMAKKAEERHATAKAFAEDLTRWLKQKLEA